MTGQTNTRTPYSFVVVVPWANVRMSTPLADLLAFNGMGLGRYGLRFTRMVLPPDTADSLGQSHELALAAGRPWADGASGPIEPGDLFAVLRKLRGYEWAAAVEIDPEAPAGVARLYTDPDDDGTADVAEIIYA